MLQGAFRVATVSTGGISLVASQAQNVSTARRARSKRSVKLHAEIVQLLKEGLTINQVVEGLGVSRRTIYAARSAAGMLLPGANQHIGAPDRHARIVELSKQGLTVQTIADKLRLTSGTVQKVRSAHGLSRPAFKATEEEKLRAKTMLHDGASYHEVARTLGRASSTIAYWHPGFQFTGAQTGQASAMARKLNRLTDRLGESRKPAGSYS